ncbi:MAG: polyamine aminopropyltransferase [Myxococcota bacterium]
MNTKETETNNNQLPVLNRVESVILLGSVFVTSICAIAYELVIGATGAYIAGDGISQFAYTIGIFLSSMGLGSLFSRAIGDKRTLEAFVSSEILIGLFGGISHPALYLIYATSSSFQIAFYFFVFIVGALTGLEIPLITRILSKNNPLRINISNVLSLDYFGALVTAVLFPLLLLPNLGLWYSSLLFGMINIILALILIFYSKKRSWYKKAMISSMFVLATLLILQIFGRNFMNYADAKLYGDEIIFTKTSKYQKIVLTRWRSDLRLYLNGNIQFSSYDEYRYHETLIHPLFSLIPHHDNVLVLGGGDGLALREIFKYEDVKNVDLVDLDPAVMKLAKTNKHLVELNKNSLNDPRVKYYPQDAWIFVRNVQKKYDVIVVDLPDPNSENLVKLYSLQFYHLLKNLLTRSGGIVVQATSPYFNHRTFWCIHDTIKETGLYTLPIHAQVPSFGDWGYVLAGNSNLDKQLIKFEVETKYLTKGMEKGLKIFPADLQHVDVQISTLDKPIILKYYNEDYKKYFK